MKRKLSLLLLAALATFALCAPLSLAQEAPVTLPWFQTLDAKASASMQSMDLIVVKPSVCQRICPTACKSDDLRPAVGTGMHFYRKRKRLLCKKCQK